MKVLSCGVQNTRCSCWCHPSGTKGKCGCYTDMPVREAKVIENLQRRESVKADVRRDGTPLSETAVENYLDKQIRRIGGRTIKVAPLVKGNPDRLVQIPFGRMYLVETKTSIGKASPAQLVWHDRSKAMGHVVHVINTRDKVDRFVRWAVMTGAGLKDGRRQAEKDWLAMVAGYPYEEHEE